MMMLNFALYTLWPVERHLGTSGKLKFLVTVTIRDGASWLELHQDDDYYNWDDNTKWRRITLYVYTVASANIKRPSFKLHLYYVHQAHVCVRVCMYREREAEQYCVYVTVLNQCLFKRESFLLEESSHQFCGKRLPLTRNRWRHLRGTRFHIELSSMTSWAISQT